jgi:O-antigen ligase
VRPPRPVALFTAATVSYVANVGLGSAVAVHLVDTRRFRWVHHALYVSTSVLAGVAASTLLWSDSRAGWRLLPAALPLLVVSQVSARSRRHPVVALSAAPFFLTSLVRAIQEQQHGVS